MEILVRGLVNGVIMAGILGIPVMGIAVIYGMTGIINFAIGSIGVFSAYITWYFMDRNVLLAILLGLSCGFGLGYLIQVLLLTPVFERRKGDLNLFFLITNSLGLIFVGLTRVIFPRPTIRLDLPRLGSLTLLGVSLTGMRLFAVLFVVGCLLLLWLVETRTRVGKSWRATSQNLRLAKVVGINTGQAFAVASGIGCMLGSLGAILWGSLYNLTLTTGFQLTFTGYIIAVVGGIGNIIGGMVAALIMGMVISFGGYGFAGAWQSVVLYGIAMVVLVLAPKGILGSERSV
ncbi:branched-chain amino acid ABC transporter permease [Candidatus Bipolaricaulota bacterium]|nr:branched-chain amino acid ABC transporter permease [Candidatus Bipolaricaulota bacterium]